MLVVMKPHATAEEIQSVCDHIEQLGYRPHPMPGAQRTAIGITGNQGALERGMLEEMSGVAEVIKVSKPYKLVSRDVKEEDTVIRFPGTNASIGGRNLAVIAGPCSIESREQAFAVAEQVAKAGAQFLRGGAYKPRTSPYAFQGLGEPGLKIMAEVREAFGLRVVTEAVDDESLALVEQYADMIQIGARNMQNYALLKRAGRSKLPVLLKRGLSATLEELLMAAEYIMSEGNYQVALCERGIRTFTDHTRNTLDLSIVPAVQRLSHLPIVVDPSHGTGKRNKVLPLARAAVAVGCDGLIIEVHASPDKALSDGAQSLYPEQFAQLMDECSEIAAVVHRQIPRGIEVLAKHANHDAAVFPVAR
ncbi:MAG: 3-deoxy-7-phosphoheptulonate synthase [Acidobacteriaceae bacterium]